MRELDRKLSDLRRREEQLDEIETDIERDRRKRRACCRRAEAAPSRPAGTIASADGRLSVFDHRQVELDRREQEVRRLEERLSGLERSLARKEADLGAFADLLQHSLARIEEAAPAEGGLDPSEPDPTQRLRFWTRDSSADGSAPRDRPRESPTGGPCAARRAA